MATAAGRATRRAVIAQANKTAEGTNLALGVATQIGAEWRVFCNLSLVWRLWWLLTGRIHTSRRRRLAAQAASADGACQQES